MQKPVSLTINYHNGCAVSNGCAAWSCDFNWQFFCGRWHLTVLIVPGASDARYGSSHRRRPFRGVGWALESSMIYSEFSLIDFNYMILLHDFAMFFECLIKMFVDSKYRSYCALPFLRPSRRAKKGGSAETPTVRRWRFSQPPLDKNHIHNFPKNENKRVLVIAL